MITKGLLASGEDWAGQVMLEVISDYLAEASVGTDAPRGTLQLKTLCDAVGIDIPVGAAAIVMDVEIQDAADGEYSLTLGYGGIVDEVNYPGRSFAVYTRPGADEWIAKLMILPITTDAVIDYLAAASGGTTLDYRFRIIGWIILGEEYRRTVQPTSPQEDLHCLFRIA